MLVPLARAHTPATRKSRSPRRGGTAKPTAGKTAGPEGASPQPRPRDSLPRNNRENNCLREGGGDSGKKQALGARCERKRGAGAGITPAVSPQPGHSAPGSPGTRDAGRPAPPGHAPAPREALMCAELWKPQAPLQGAGADALRTQKLVPPSRGNTAETKGWSPGSPSPDLPFPRDWFRSDTSAGRTTSRHLFTFPSESARKTRRSDSISQHLGPGPGLGLLAHAQGLRRNPGRGIPAPRDGHRAHVTFAKPPWTFPDPRRISKPGNNGISYNPCFSSYYFSFTLYLFYLSLF